MATRVPMSTPVVGSQRRAPPGRAQPSRHHDLLLVASRERRHLAAGPAVTSQSCVQCRRAGRRRVHEPAAPVERPSTAAKVLANGDFEDPLAAAVGRDERDSRTPRVGDVAPLRRALGDANAPVDGVLRAAGVTYGSSSTPAPTRPAMPRISPRWTSRSTPRSQRPCTSRASRTTGASRARRHGRAVVGIDLLADDQARQLPCVDARDIVRGDHAAAAQDGHAVGQLEDLVETVGDEENARPARRTSRTTRTAAPPVGGRTAVGSSRTSTPLLARTLQAAATATLPARRARAGHGRSGRVDAEARQLAGVPAPAAPGASRAPRANRRAARLSRAVRSEETEVLVDEAQPGGTARPMSMRRRRSPRTVPASAAW